MARRPYIVFANDNYRSVLLNWLVTANFLAITNVLIVGYDRRLVRFLQERGFMAVYLPMRQGKENLWERLYVFEALARNGVPFIHCDADAILLRNPETYLDGYSPTDVVFSQGTVHPVAIARSRGFTVCMGFFSATGSTAAHKLFVSALSIISKTKTDQAAVNHALEELVDGWQIDEETLSELSYRGTSFVISSSPIASKTGSEIDVTVLPHDLFQRYFLGITPETFLVHPLANQKANTKQQILEDMGLWKLHPNWADIPFHRDSLDQLLSSHQ